VTYAASFKTDHGIYLTTDSAVSGGSVHAIHDDTFFGEPSSAGDYSISDNAVKLFKISNTRLIAAAGNAQQIYSCVDYLRQSSDQFESLKELIISIDQALSSVELGAVTFICAEYLESTFKMGIWRSGDGYHVPSNNKGVEASAICTGSGMVYDYLTDNVAKSIRHITAGTLDNNLAFISCCHQLHGVHANHVLNRVGGAFVTAVLNNQGIVWQPDITYFRYSPSQMLGTPEQRNRLRMFFPVSLVVREGVLFVERRAPEYRAAVIANGVSAVESSEIIQKYSEEASSVGLNLNGKYGAFLSTEDPYAFLVHHFDEDYCYRNKIRKDSAQIIFSEDFYHRLRAKPEIGNFQGAMKVDTAPSGFLSQDYVPPKLDMSYKEL